MVEIVEIIGSVIDTSTAKMAGERLKKVAHKMTSLSESQIMFRRKLEELNLKYDKGSGDYVVKADRPESVVSDAQPA